MKFMRTRASSTSMSWPGITGAFCGILTILLGILVLLGWAIHAPVLIQVMPDLAPMQRNTAVSFALIGLALLGIVRRKPRLTLIGSVITGTIAAASLFPEVPFGASTSGSTNFWAARISLRRLQTLAACRRPRRSVSSCWPPALRWRKPCCAKINPPSWVSRAY